MTALEIIKNTGAFSKLPGSALPILPIEFKNSHMSDKSLVIHDREGFDMADLFLQVSEFELSKLVLACFGTFCAVYVEDGMTWFVFSIED